MNFHFLSYLRGSCLSICFLLFFNYNANAQLRINCGYELGFTTNSVANKILSNYNASNPNAISPFGSFGLSHGVIFGLRYELDFLGVEATWVYRFEDEETVLSEIDGVIMSTDLLGRYQTFSFGIDNQFDWFSYGGSIDFNLTSINAKIDNQDNKSSFLKENNYSTTFYIGFNTDRSNQIRLSLRPFIKIPITSIDYEALDINLNQGTTVSDPKERPIIFGLRIIFANG